MGDKLLSIARTFHGGIHPPDQKEITEEYPIQDYMDPKEDMVFPMQQHLGAPCRPIVAKGERVLRDQRIGEPTGFVGAPVYSSVSGTVKDVKPMLHPNGQLVMSVIVENDHLYETIQGPYKPGSPEGLTREEILERIQYAGIVGMGGAGFPTHIKLNPPPDKKIDYILINGSECEPYLTSDYRVMLEDTDRLLNGVRLVHQLFPEAKCCIAVENNKLKAIKILDRCLKSQGHEGKSNEGLEIVQLLTKYPQGGEKMLINAVTGREVPSGGLPADVGCIVLNIDTVVAIYRAVVQARPLQRRIVTVTGRLVNRPGNYRVRIGTSFRELVEAAGGLKEEPAKIICGGPMMGLPMTTLDVPVIKTSSSLLLLGEEEARLPEESACIRCGKCIEACPMHLQPYELSELARRGEWDNFEKENGCECIECGCCGYICPAKRHLTQAMKLGRKTALANRKKRMQEESKK